MKQINGDQQNRIIDTFNDHLRAQLFEMIPLSDTVYHTARWVLSKTEAPLRTLDSLHLAFSITNRLALFSTDSVLLDAATDLRVDVVSGI